MVFCNFFIQSEEKKITQTKTTLRQKKNEEKRFCCLLQRKQAEIKKNPNINTYITNTLLHVNYKAELFKHLQGNDNPCLSREQWQH